MAFGLVNFLGDIGFYKQILVSSLLLFRMKEVDVGGVGQALLVRDGSSFYAVGPKCSHYGAPLEKGKWETRP